MAGCVAAGPPSRPPVDRLPPPPPPVTNEVPRYVPPGDDRIILPPRDGGVVLPPDGGRNDRTLLPPVAGDRRNDVPRGFPGPSGFCDAAAASFTIGMPADDRTIDAAVRRSGAQRVRVMRPGMAGTMEFDPSRLTIQIDRRGLIESVACG